MRSLGEFKGKQDLFKQQSPQVLEALRQSAIIQSTESSNRIEGVVAPHNRIKELVAGKTKPQNRSEQEIAGYRDVLSTIHTSHQHIPLSSNIVLQLHRDLYKFVPGQGGRWKAGDNTITEKRADGSEVVRFTPVAAHRTPQAMDDLHVRFNAAWQAGDVDHLLLIGAYVLDFVCIHPFTDGNGRMARLLTLLLLYKGGYEVGRYISLETMVEQHKDGYYDALYSSSQGWHEGKHTLTPWWEFLLGVNLLAAYQEFEQRVGSHTARRGAKRQLIVDAVDRLPKHFRYADLERACPAVSRPTINRVLAELRRKRRIACVKTGRDATWEKRDRKR